LLVVLLLSAIEHNTWARSSSLLDWTMFWYTIEHYQELRPIIAAETTVFGVALIVAAVVLALVPAIADLVAARQLGFELRWRRREALIAAGLALPLAWFAAGQPSEAELYPLTPSASFALLAGAFESSGHARGSANFTPPDAEHTRQRVEQALQSAGLSLTPDPARPKNVLLVILESTRFDATSLYTPRLNTTPRLKQLAEHGAMVQRAFVDMPHTSKALVSVLCGYSPRWSVQVGEAEPGGITRPCLPHALGKLGYDRAFFQAATGGYESRHQFALNAGFEEVFTRESFDETGFEETNYLSVEDKVMVKPINKWLAAHKTQPFFLTVLTCITHHSYGLPTNFPLVQYPRQPANVGARMPRPFADYNRYLNTVQYADQFMGELIDALTAQGLLEDTLIVVVGDHGQGFFEHGQKAHNTVIWEEGLHVPLVVHSPKLFPEPRSVPGVRRQVDIAPTILTQLGARFAPDMFEGRDLLSGAEHEYAYSSCWYDKRCAAETGTTLRVIDHYDNQPMEVYDLIADPYERRNLRSSGSQKERVKYDEIASQARTRIQAHAAEIDGRYSLGDASAHEFLLSKAPRPSHPVRARLDDAIELLGYDTASLDVTPDGFWDAVVYFRCLKPSTLGWQLFGELETVDGRQDQVDHHPANGKFYLHECKAGQYVADHIRVWIPGDYPPGELRYWWGSVLLKELGHVSRENKRIQRREVFALERGVLVRDQALLLAKLEVKPQYRPELAELLKTAVSESAPKIAKPLNIRVGEGLTLMQASVEPAEARAMSSLTIRTLWRVDAEQDGPWQLLAHMDSEAEGFWSRLMHPPVGGIHPVARWKPGTWVTDTYAMPIPEYMPPGEVKVYVGVRSSSRRMRAYDPQGNELEDRRAYVGSVQIKR
jgi:arylsulfatase A-like enzyme